MATAGGFCERHGPYDPPHVTCPYCVMEDAQRQAYGPPQHTQPARADDDAPDVSSAPPAEDGPVMTEVIARDDTIPEPDADVAPAEPLGWLVVRRPAGRRGTIVAVRPNQTIGREGDVRFEDPGLSRLHARLTFEPPADSPDAPSCFHLWPFGTTNPVFVNGHEIRGATPLSENDEIRLGDTLFVFKQLLD